ncbi:hypothetical protein J6590_032534 [Homalodisca vitripennis]|nr:hypothetical protein J6590_032534 [Homalodisca vitripennis]
MLRRFLVALTSRGWGALDTQETRQSIHRQEGAEATVPVNVNVNVNEPGTIIWLLISLQTVFGRGEEEVGAGAVPAELPDIASPKECSPSRV